MRITRRLTGLLSLAAAVLLAFPGAARASHYDLTSIDLVEPEMAAKLAQLKVQTTEDLWKATATPKLVGKLSGRLKVTAARLRDWHDFCDLLRIIGVGPKVVRVMQLCGVKRTEQLVGQDPTALTAKIKTTNAQASILGKLPDEDTVRSWIEQAKKLSSKK